MAELRTLERSPGARDAILAAALKLFAERGFHGATMREIAQEAGISQGLLHHHFGNKDGLWHAVGERISRAFLDYVSDVTNPESPPDIMRAISTYLRYWKQHPAAFRFNLWRLLEGPTAERRSRSKSLTQLAAPVFARAQQAGDLRDDVPAGLLLNIAGAATQFWLHSQIEIRDSLAVLGEAPVNDEAFVEYLSKLLAPSRADTRGKARANRSRRSKA